MELPIKFPTEEDVLREETARFRALTPNEQRDSLDEMFRLYHFLLKRNDQPERAIQAAEDEEARGRAAILEVAAHHRVPN